MEEQPLYLQIAESLRRQIATGELVPGDTLPPIRDTARVWECTPGTASRAYRQLAREGLVVGHAGRGTVVADKGLGKLGEDWTWPELINRLEAALLEAKKAGFTTADLQSALSFALDRVERGPRIGESRSKGRVQGKTSFAGSHDLLIPHLTRLVQSEAGLMLEVEYHGSLGGLMRLSQREADLAGSHLWDESSGEFNCPFVERVLPGIEVALVTLAHREVGFILPAGNPQGIQGLEDLLQEGVAFVNRQPGSGTRVWLDSQMKERGLEAHRLQGYDQVVTTHSAVAQWVSRGRATAGLGLAAAAFSLGLDFLPLHEERYDLVVPPWTWDRPITEAIISTLRSDAFREVLRATPGYGDQATGEVIWCR